MTQFSQSFWNWSLRSVFVAALALPTFGAEDPVAEGRAIMAKADANGRNYVDESVTLNMVLINANGDSTTRRMKSINLERANSEDYSLIQFLEPADVRGTGLLTWQNPRGDDRQWLYLPELRRVKTIASQNKSGSFMGSEFAYEDISGNTLDKFTYRKLGEETIAGEDCWTVERIPTYKNSGYTRVKSWIAKSDYLLRRQEFTDRKGSLLKVQTYKGWQAFESPKGKSWRISQITVENLQTKKKSILTFTERKLASGLKEDVFNERNLQRLQF
jgi:Outer membrane lipoprotein-sorting protein